MRLGGVFLLRPFSRRVDESPHVPMTLFPGQVLHSIGIAACHRAMVKKSGASVDTAFPRDRHENAIGILSNGVSC